MPPRGTQRPWRKNGDIQDSGRKRTTKTIQDYTDGTETTESNITTEYGYDGDNNVIYVRADEPNGSSQETDYIYGVTTAGGSGVNSNDILSAIQHPDPTTGQPNSLQQDTYLVNALGQVVWTLDRNGTMHQYSYDVLGRLTSQGKQGHSRLAPGQKKKKGKGKASEN